MAEFTETQGHYLAFILAHIRLRGFAPSQAEFVELMGVSPPSVNQMIKRLHAAGLIHHEPGKARSIKLLIPDSEIPVWDKTKFNAGKSKSAGLASDSASGREKGPSKFTAQNLYVLTVSLPNGPGRKPITREIQMPGDYTLHHLHVAIFVAYDREDEHLYVFQFGARMGSGSFGRHGPRYGMHDDGKTGDAFRKTLDGLKLQAGQVFGYLFDFGDEWHHEIQVDRIEQTVAGVEYPKFGKRVGKSPPQYEDY